MASTLRAAIARTRSKSPQGDPSSSANASSSETEAESSSNSRNKDQYRLLVTAGPSYEAATHKIVHVNSDNVTTVENEFLKAQIKVRIRGFRGLPTACPANSPYFDHAAHVKDQYSIAFSFVPKRDLPALDTIWGNDFDHPVRDRLPPGFNYAFKIVKEFIDPGLECDAYADQPWLYGPSLSCWFAFRVGDQISGQADEALPASKEEKDDILREGADGSGADVRAKLQIPEDSEKRRKFFLSASHREQMVFEKDRLYHADFFNPYLDFGNFALKLPGFSIKVLKYIDEKSHCLRYVFKNRRTGEVYFCVNMNLLWGEQLQRAIKDDSEQVQALAGAEDDVD